MPTSIKAVARALATVRSTAMHNSNRQPRARNTRRDKPSKNSKKHLVVWITALGGLGGVIAIIDSLMPRLTFTISVELGQKLAGGDLYTQKPSNASAASPVDASKFAQSGPTTADTSTVITENRLDFAACGEY